MNDSKSIQFSENKEIITLYIDTAKTFLNLSSGALALTIILRKDISGTAAGTPVGNMMLAAWIFYLLTIGFSALYQYFGVKFLDTFSSSEHEVGICQYFEKKPGNLYGSMLVCFFLGSLFLVITAYQAVP